MTKTDEIYEALATNRDLTKVVDAVDELTVISYDGADARWCNALKQYLETHDKDTSCVTRIVLLGISGAQKVWIDIVNGIFPDAEIVSYAETWDKIDPHSIYIDTPLVLHFAFSLNKDTDSKSLVQWMEHTRLLYAVQISEISKKISVTVSFNIESFAHTEESDVPLLTDTCLSKAKDIRRYRKELSPQAALAACLEEAKHGCETFCVANYGKTKLCPLAQHEAALLYRHEDNATSQSLSHQLDRLSAYQGYTWAHIQIADNMAEGCGCDKDIYAALAIYKRYAHNGNTTCSDRIIQLAEKEDEISKLVALPWIIQKANDGDLDKANELVKIFEDGLYGVPINHTYSRQWQTKLAESGDEKYIAELRENAQAHRDWKEAIKWSRKLRDLGSSLFDKDIYAGYIQRYIHELAATPARLNSTGRSFLIGSTETRDLELAEACLVASAEAGYLPAQEFLCEEYFWGKNFKENYQQSVYWGDKALEQGSKSVRFRMAWLYDNQKGVTPDYTKAHKLYKELAKEGNSAAMNNLGWMCDRGHFYTVNPKKAFEWYLKAAEFGSDVACRNVGYCYRKGDGVEKDYSLALKWFMKAADKGDETAMEEVAKTYRYGWGVEKDTAKVVEWYTKAFEAGNKDALLEIARYYEKDISDYVKAAEYYKKSAEQGNDDAQYYLAELYMNGRGVNQDQQTAIYWYRKAAVNDNENAQTALENLGLEWMEKDDE